MKIIIDDQNKTEEIEIVIKGSRDNKQVQKLYQTLLYYDQYMTGTINQKKYQLPINQILYFDTVDNKTFAYTSKEVYDINYRLYELEEQLESSPFLRVNKHTIINLKKIKSFHSTINGRMEAQLINLERIKISRRYVAALKQKLGGRSL